MRMMVGSLSEDLVATDGGLLGMQHCQSVDSLVEYRSCDQVENGIPSTSPPYWDIDDDDDVGPKPSDLYGKFTWKIENFSQISKRELRSNAFEIGGYKWYILIYPQGCDVCDYLSLFLCVANHDKLLPGWSHFAQFTIAVVNKDTKKNKYSDTLHRFWKKEHDWGWKKFMELSKMSDGFADDDILTIKAQVQVIREKAHRPFRCLDCQYRRELIRVYVSSVEQTCHRYLEERKDKLSKLVNDKEKWSSFHAFWFGMDQSVRRGMSKDKTGTILKLVVKQFFIEKEVISTLVMDSLYSGLRVLEFQSKRNKGRARIAEKEELHAPMIAIEEDMFVLADDVFLLLERAALESLPLPLVPPKDDKVVQNRAKVGTSGDEFSRDSIVRDERKLTELGRKTLEIFVLAHIFSSRIEVAFKEAVSLKRQEELIREEEAAGQAAIELKAKRSALEKEKRARKKQAKQKRCNHKGKDRGKDDKLDGALRVKIDDLSPKEVQKVHARFDKMGDISDLSDPVDDGDEASQADEVDKDSSPHSWETITSEIHPTTEASVNAMQNGKMEKKNPSSLDDSSSTSSADSVLSVVGNVPYKNNPSLNRKNKQSSSRGKKQWSEDIKTRPSSDVGRVLDANGSCRQSFPESDGKLHLKDQIHRLEEHPHEKVEVAMTLENQLINEDEAKVETGLVPRTTELSSSSTPSRKLLSVKQLSTISTAIGSLHTNKPMSDIPTKVVPSVPSTSLSLTSSVSRSEAPKHITQPMTTTVCPASSMSRPSSAPLMIIPVTRTTASLVSTTQTSPLLSRTLSSITHLVTDPSSASQNYEPQSYRNAIMGIRTAKEPRPAALTSRPSLPSLPSLPSSSHSFTLSQPHSSFSSSSSTQTTMTDAREELVSVDPGFSSVSGKPGVYDHWHRVTNKNNTSSDSDGQSCPSQGGISDEFPHIDIINDLLDEDEIVGRTFSSYHLHHDYHPMDYTFPRDSATSDISVLTGSSGHSDMFEPYYDDASQMAYDSSGLPFQLLGDALPLQLNLLTYGGGQIDAPFQNQWPIGSPDMSMLNFSGNVMNMDAYSYQFPGLSAFVGGYNMMYQPADGV